MNLVTKLQILWLSFLFWMMAISISYWAYETPESYLSYCKFTDSQIEKVKELSKTTRDPEHYIKRIWAIASHEMGRTFKDWETKYFAGRLAQDMKYKDFNTQAEARTKAYNKYWYKNKTASDWINRSRYCVSDTHWWGKWCPNRVANVPSIIALYNKPAISHKKETVTTLRPAPTPKPRDTKRVVSTPKKQIKKICRQVSTIQEDNSYVQVDTMRWEFINRMRWLNKWTKVFVCKDL